MLSNQPYIVKVNAPSDDFVATVFVTHGQSIQPDQKLVQLDTTREELILQKLDTTEKVNEIALRKYVGSQFDEQVKMATTAIALAQAVVDDTTLLLKNTSLPAQLGVLKGPLDVEPVQIQLDQANVQLQSAESNLVRLKQAAQNYQDTSQYVKSHIEAQKDFINEQIKRKTIKSTVAGKVSLHVAVGTFVKLGHLILEIEVAVA